MQIIPASNSAFLSFGAAAALPAGTFIGPVTFNESDPNLYGVNTSPSQPLTNSPDWNIESYYGYVDGKGAYTTATLNGYTFGFSGTGFSLGGLANANGGNFSVELDGAVIGNGNCANPTLIQKTYFSITGLTAGLHTVKTRKSDGAALFADTFSVFA